LLMKSASARNRKTCQFEGLYPASVCRQLIRKCNARYKVLRGAIGLRVRDIIRQVCEENDVEIIKGVLSQDHVHLFVSVPPKLSVSDFMRKAKGRSSRKIQMELSC